MTDYLSPEDVVRAQLDAFNARDIKAWLAIYAMDARQFFMARPISGNRQNAD